MKGSLFTVISVFPRDATAEPVGRRVKFHAQQFLNIDTGRVMTSKVYAVRPARDDSQKSILENGVRDAVSEYALLDPKRTPQGYASFVSVDKQHGVTDDEASTVLRVLEDAGDEADGERTHACSRTVYWIEKALSREELKSIAEDLVGNPLIHCLSYGPAADYAPPSLKQAKNDTPPTQAIDLGGTDEELMKLSVSRLLSLNVTEMRAIASYFEQENTRQRRRQLELPDQPTDCELEILAQTWSEHCKHKEFNALITFKDEEEGTEEDIDSLFDTYIRGATRIVREQLESWGQMWLVKVFNDNAGVVQIDDDRVFVWKVETHNSPSALDPYGGAITGILGNNRDPLGTGRGGGRLLFNTDVLCFGPPDYNRPLLPGQLHPLRVLSGVRKGIEDGGNKSGIPTVNGALVFDDRYAGKPLVYCGTGSIAPARINGQLWHEKHIDPGDVILMAGGRVGKDGIHGATFSSERVDETTPRSVVQIGSPITQKLLSDFLETAVLKDLIKCCTDNGAGGLSSSIGELAQLSGGADVEMSQVPLKYEGIAPWEIFVSESQERMTLVVEPEDVQDVLDLAERYDVEVTAIGQFTASGSLVVRYQGNPIASIDLEFLHDGVPRKRMNAIWRRPRTKEIHLPVIKDVAAVCERILANPNVCSREALIRQYDHEVKGRTVVKPLMGRTGKGPQDAAVVRLGFEDFRGIAISNGIAPQYGDLDPYAMSAGAFDEAVRQIVAVGGRLPGPEAGPMGFWSVNDNFCVPNSAHDPLTNPDGEKRLGSLVRMCQALFDIATAYSIPLTSGKDSMKNDFHAGGKTISVPPTVLYSMVAGIPDVRRAVTTDFKSPGDALYLIGATYREFAGSQISQLLGLMGGTVPGVRFEEARERYARMAHAHEQGLISSCHDLSDGGLAVALFESAIGAGLGFDVSLDEVPQLKPVEALFSESHSRFVVSVAPVNQEAFETAMRGDVLHLGQVVDGSSVSIRAQGNLLIDASLALFERAWDTGLEDYL